LGRHRSPSAPANRRHRHTRSARRQLRRRHTPSPSGDHTLSTTWRAGCHARVLPDQTERPVPARSEIAQEGGTSRRKWVYGPITEMITMGHGGRNRFFLTIRTCCAATESPPISILLTLLLALGS